MSGRRNQGLKAQGSSLSGNQRQTRSAASAHIPEADEITADSNSDTESRTIDVVDLTCDTGNDEFVDLTSCDNTVILVDTAADSASSFLSSTSHVGDIPELLTLSESDSSDCELPPIPFKITRKAATPPPSLHKSPAAATLVCPICLDGLTEMKAAKHDVMSTTCGHIFCSECMKAILANRGNSSQCPTCRKKITSKSVHKLFI